MFSYHSNNKIKVGYTEYFKPFIVVEKGLTKCESQAHVRGVATLGHTTKPPILSLVSSKLEPFQKQKHTVKLLLD